MNRGIPAFLLLLVVMIEEGRTAPTPINNPNSDTTIPILKIEAKREINSVFAEIQELETYTVRY